MTRGQNRIAGLAAAKLIAAIKHSLYNEERLRAWHQRTDLGPADHPCCNPTSSTTATSTSNPPRRPRSTTPG
jgi:hypothetical protein